MGKKGEDEGSVKRGGKNRIGELGGRIGRPNPHWEFRIYCNSYDTVHAVL